MSRLLGHGPLTGMLACGFIGLASPAHSQVTAWLDFDGKIKGGATDSRHLNWIDIHGFSVGTGRAVSGDGSGAPRETGTPSVSEVSLTKWVDRASPQLFLAAVVGNAPYPLVTLDLNAGVDQPLIRLKLENVLLSGQSGAAGGTDKATESISLNFEKITYIYIQPDSRTIFSSYDLRTGEGDSGTGGGVTNPDSDADSMPDAWESTYGLAVGTNDANGDADGDGLSNLHEYQLGTHPRSGSSFFKAELTASAASPGTCDIRWNSVPGKIYVIEWTADLATPFAPVQTVTASAATTTVNRPRSGPLGFYRVRPQ